MEGHGINITVIKQAQKMNTIVEVIYRREETHTNQLNEGLEIKLHRDSRNQSRIKNYLLMIMYFPI